MGWLSDAWSGLSNSGKATLFGGSLLGSLVKGGDSHDDPKSRVYDPFQDFRGVFGQKLADLSVGKTQFSTTDPSYQFRYDQGLEAVNRSMAAQGQLGSGLQMKSLMDYGQASASQEYGNEWNRLASLAGVGQTAGVGNTNMGNQFMQNLGAGMGLFQGMGGMQGLSNMFGGSSAAGSSMMGGDIGTMLGSDFGTSAGLSGELASWGSTATVSPETMAMFVW